MKMINKFFIIFSLISILGFSQEIKISDDKFITIIFDSNVIQGAIGNNDYTLDYNEDGKESIVLLKANKKSAKPTNLIIKTEQGYLYNIDVIFGTPEKNIITISTETGVKTKTTGQVTNTSSDGTKKSVRENDYTIGNTVINDAEKSNINCEFCDKIIKLPKKVKRISVSNFSITIQLDNIYYFSNKLYLAINIINNSDIDYNINYIKTYVNQEKDSETSTAQYLEKNPVELFNTSKTIKGNTSKKMIFIYDQFTIDKNKKLVFELNEANGERNLPLHIPYYILNNPLNLKKIN